MRRFIAFGVLITASLCPTVASARCASFNESTMDAGGIAKAQWRTDYPPGAATAPPWQSIDFRAEPAKYMTSVLDIAKPQFRREARKLVGTGTEEWWISLWLDYGTSGREPFMGLTKERGPDPGDLSPTSGRGYQVWAVGFYNAAGAAVLGSIFAQPCNPQVPTSVLFPEGTASIKFLFTDASPDEVEYLKGAPEYDANIDEPGSGSGSRPLSERRKTSLRLLQVDIAVKDNNASETGWVFGTFGWMGPRKGDGLYDNLVPVSLQWGNDPGIYDARIAQGWINPAVQGVMYGWPARPFLGFNGRANGPADNLRSSCLSCHAAARKPRARKGILGRDFRMPSDMSDTQKVRDHVDFWFINVKAGDLFDPGTPAVATLDYSLQLEAALDRICRACRSGALTGPTPAICLAAGSHSEPTCGPGMTPFDVDAKRRLEEDPPPRQ